MIHWFLSKTVRQASDMKRQVRMLLNEQRDLLKPEAVAALEASLASMETVLRENPGKDAVTAEMDKLEESANKHLKPYPASSIRENVKEIVVAITTIMAFTTFFLQLTKIPTGSMQPTLYGITDENLLDKPDVQIPNYLGRVKDYWVHGIQWESFVAPVDGEFEDALEPQTIIPFIKKQRFKFAGEWHRILFPGDGLFGWSESGRGTPRAVIRRGVVKKGEYVFKLKIYAGDHLLVDRFTYNFRKPQRGEIVVFKTRGIPDLPQDQLYIKRLVGLPNEKIQIGNDRHLIVDGRRLSSTDRHFEAVYNFDDKNDPILKAQTPDEAVGLMGMRLPPYRGHVNDKVAHEFYKLYGIPLAPKFRDETEVYTVEPHHFMPMGDNTLNSHDSRVWGNVDEKNLMGKCWFVYWPISDRFGWGYR